MSHYLLGFADPIGLGSGFLTPLFGAGGNALYVQKLDRECRIAGFEALDDFDGRIVHVDHELVERGYPYIWAFAFSHLDRVVGQGEAGRQALTERLNDGSLKDRPMLAVDVAEFLELPRERLAWAHHVFDRLGGQNSEAAKAWRDLSILTPDVRGLLASEKDGDGWADRLVVLQRGDEIRVRGLPPHFQGQEAQITDKAIRAALADLELDLSRTDRGVADSVRTTSAARAYFEAGSRGLLS